LKIKYYLEAEAWEIFAIVVGSMTVGAILRVYSIETEHKIILLIVSALLYMACLISWLFTLGESLHSRLPKSVKLSLLLFRVNLVFAFIYGCIFIIYFGQFDPENDMKQMAELIKYIFPFQMYLIFSFMYANYFIAKSIVAIEEKQDIDFGKYFIPFIQLWIFPIGIWYLQPRIRKIFL
jgi:hypothetical protein